MNDDFANALSAYLEVLYYANQNLIKLCGIDAISDFETSEKEILDIIQDVPRLIPYAVNKATKKLECKNSDGLLEYRHEIRFLKEEYNKILSDNYDFLNLVRKIRNKYEHKMHSVTHISTGSGNLKLFDFSFEIDNEKIILYSGQFIRLFKSLNILFSNIVKDVNSYVYENNKTSLFYRRITKVEFTDFNKIYESELLYTIGTLMRTF